MRDSEFHELRYDYIRPPAERDAAAKSVIAAWTKGQRGTIAKRTDRSAILLETDGQLRTDEIDRLLEAQDKRPLTLAE